MQTTRTTFLKLLMALALVLLIAAAPQHTFAQIANHVVIAQIYGGGGNTGAQYHNDFVVLYNPTSSPVSLSGWSIQYATSAGSWNGTVDGPISGTIAAHGFFLIQGAAGTGAGASLPTPDADFSGGPNFSATNATLALVNNATQLAGDPSGNANVIDYIGYGTAMYHEGTAVGVLSNTTAGTRKAQSTSTAAAMENGGADSLNGNGWDSNNNSADIVITWPYPLNSSSPLETPPSLSYLPPSISAETRSPFIPSAGTTDTVSATIADLNGGSSSITGALLHIRKNGGNWDSSTVMTVLSGSTYIGVVSTGTNGSNGDLIEYYVSATNSDGGSNSGYSNTISTLQGYMVGISKISQVKALSLNAISGYGIQVTGYMNVKTNTYTNGQGYIQDSTGGLQLFQTGGLPVLALGRNARIQGTITNFSNAYELETPNLKFFDTVGTTTVNPITITLPQTASATNQYEGRYVTFLNMTTDSTGTFAAPKDYFYKDGSNNLVDVLVQSNGTNNNCVGKSIPAGSVTLGGIFVFSNSSLLLKPRMATDLGVAAGDGTGTVAITPTFQFQGTVAVKETLTVTGDGTHDLGGLKDTIPSTWTWDGSSYATSGAGFAGASVSVTGNGSSGTPWVITVTNVDVTNTNTGTIIISNLTAPAALGATKFWAGTEGVGGNFAAVASSPAVTIVSPTEAVATGNWSSPSTWANHTVPDSTNDVTMSTLGVTVTIDIANARCRSLVMTGSGTAASSGPVLQFLPSGASGLTVYSDVSVTGGTGGGGGDRGGRPQLTSNGNASAVLSLKGSVVTTSSNSTSNGNAGFNMNEGTVKFIGAGTDTMQNGAGFRLANLEVGDGTNAKTLVLVPTSSATMDVLSIHVKTNSSLHIGNSTGTTLDNIGYSGTDSSVAALTGGITIDNGGSITTLDNPAALNTATMTLLGGGITNNGTLNLTTVDSCSYILNFGLSGGASASQTVSGTGTTTLANSTIAANDTVAFAAQVTVDPRFSLVLNGRMAENAGKAVQGNVAAVRTVAQSTLEDFGGIGFSINAAGAAPGSTAVMRVTGSHRSGVASTHSINRYFNVLPAVNSGLNAAVVFGYDTLELVQTTENAATLSLWSSSDGSTFWSSIPATNTPAQHRLSAAGVNSLQFYLTAADANNILGSGAFAYHLNTNWNMVSLPLTVPDYRKSTLFPTATSHAFTYQGSYLIKDTMKNALGYWLKFPAAETVFVSGASRTLDTVPVIEGWNMIGSISNPVYRSSITQMPGGIVHSNFFGYNGASYVIIDTVVPGKGYWVKTTGTGGNGKLVLSSGAAAQPKQSQASLEDAVSSYSTLTVTDRSGNKQVLYVGEQSDPKADYSVFEMPPAAPEVAFDARFGSGRYVETFAKNGSNGVYPILLKSSSYPVTIEWNIHGAGVRNFGLSNVKTSLKGQGKVTLAKEVPSLELTVSGSSTIPAVFSLSPNYPNPFNPSTRFDIGVPRTAEVTVTVYDLLGQEVRTLLHDVKAAGTYTVEWNGLTSNNTAATSGMYFVRMTSDKFTSVRKIVLMK